VYPILELSYQKTLKLTVFHEGKTQQYIPLQYVPIL
jgi:hypothetical protein